MASMEIRCKQMLVCDGSSQKVLDDQSLANYKHKQEELQKIVSSGTADPATIVEAKDDLKAINDLLSKETGLRGKSRKFDPSAHNRNADAIEKNIGRAKDLMKKQPALVGLVRHLDECLKPHGYYPTSEVLWDL